jgi:hypothetical protein
MVTEAVHRAPAVFCGAVQYLYCALQQIMVGAAQIKSGDAPCPT